LVGFKVKNGVLVTVSGFFLDQLRPACKNAKFGSNNNKVFSIDAEQEYTMKHIKAIGFDLFNTLVMAKPDTLTRAFPRLLKSLKQNGICPEEDAFKKAYYEAAVMFVKQAREDGRETHNRFWISAALEDFGYHVLPDDPRIAIAVEDYFSTFYDSCYRVPGTRAMLERLKDGYQLGLLSNFTHWPAALEIIHRLELEPFFEVRLISGQLGYRKPHGEVFSQLIGCFDAHKDEIMYVGDDVDADVNGSTAAGIQPVWFTYVLDHKSPIPPLMAPSETEAPHERVPRVSTWSEFLSLLKMP
jgi:putative hydrolase of the HAD superfamily